MLTSPGVTLATMILFFGMFALLDGTFTAVSSLFRIGTYSRWWVLLLSGLLGIAVGLVALVWPGLTALTVLWLVAFWAMATGILQVMVAFRFREEIGGEWFMGISGALSLAVGVLLILWPASGILSLLWLLGFYAVLFGVAMILLSFRVRSLAVRTGPNLRA